ncbi:helicase C-terminal domain-containing protein [Streptomyces sp. 110]|uniref:Helicase C-terminal domain-containing protein n=1 Tax=Streptomyces endocoffeicus TaxID=2898945 RepID=A0ABS1PQA9_9ACTN|nr:helicase C-terminal domain-containing protein [Streptomyces endocoffeicus]
MESRGLTCPKRPARATGRHELPADTGHGGSGPQDRVPPGGGPRDGGHGDRGRGVPRTLADELRTRPDDALAALLRARPDLLSPVPNDLTQLATRAGTRASVVRAVERLDRFAQQTAEALAVAPDPCSYETLRDLLTGDEGPEPEEAGVSGGSGDSRSPEEPGGPGGAGTPASIGAPLPAEERAAIVAELPRAVATLREQALIWGGDDRFRLVRTARELLAPSPTSPSPTGLGPTVQEATSGMSPGRLQELLAAAGQSPTHDPVTAAAALAELFRDRARMAALLDGAPAGAAGVLAKLTWGPPYGEASVASPTPPIGWLLDHGLLLPSGPRNVVLPREVALHLRHGRAHRTPEPFAPSLSPTTEHDPQVVDNTAAGQTFTALATVEELLGQWETAGPPVLRAGGLSVRDLKRTAVALDVSEPVAAFWIELAYAAGLVASDGETDERYAPTPAYDDWLRLPAEERWARLAAAWLPATRTSGLVGGRDSRGRTLAALGPELDRSPAPEVRRRVLELLATLPHGAAAAPDVLLARLRWERPTGHRGAPAPTAAAPGAATPSGSAPGAASSTPGAASSAAGATSFAATWSSAAVPGTASTAASPTGAPPTGGFPTGEDLRSRLARWAVAEAEMIGVTGRGALSAHGRALLERHPDEPTAAESDLASAQAARLLAPLLPEPLDHVLLQADLTAVAPGPLERPLAETLGILADVESKGGATVYRFTPESVRRALDAGRTADDVHTFLAAHSRTPVPQPLAYLVDDVARKHGRLRIGAASAYLRCDDDALLAEILADRRSAGLRLRRLAPTVLAAQAPPDTLLEGLRAMGYAPAAESAEGDVLVSRAEAQRTPPRRPPVPVPEGPPVPDATLLGAAVRAIRAGDLAATAPHKPVVAAEARSETATGSRAGAGAGSRSGSGSRSGAGVGSGSAAGGDRLPRTTSADTLATMQAAALTGSNVWIGYVNANGAATQRVIAPVRVEGGFVTAYDHTADEVRTYPLHRITGAAELAEDAT